MNDIQSTIEQARRDLPATDEAARILSICNACRYCEGFCAVFPAMTQRLSFSTDDVHYLANLCHNCGACLHACQYAPPHEFAVNVPQTLAQVRVQTYAQYAWPSSMARAYQHNGLMLAMALAGGLSLFLLWLWLTNAAPSSAPFSASGANFYAVFPHGHLVQVFGAVFGFSLLAMAVGAVRFWRKLAPLGSASPALPVDALHASQDALTLKYLGDCNNADDATTPWRRRFHHLTFYGFMLCFASTSVATLYHYALGRIAPYDFFSIPVVLGTAGGLAMLLGTLGLAWMHDHRHPQHGDFQQKPMGQGFIALLFLTALTGLVLLGMRSTPWMPPLLAIHLGVVLALFITMPYGKMMHGVYRGISLLQWAKEKRAPAQLGVE